MRKWAKERFSQLLVSQEDIKDEETAKMSEGSSEMQDAQMSGVTWKEAEKGVTTEESSAEEGIPVKKKRRNAISDADRRLGFAPYSEFTYEEILRSKPGYVKFLIEEGGRGNTKGRFTLLAMGSMVDAFFKRGGGEQEETKKEDEQKKRNFDRRKEREGEREREVIDIQG